VDIGIRIKQYLRDNGISQAFLSAKTRIPTPKLNLTLNARRKLSLEEYEAICIALGVSFGTFLKSSPPEDASATSQPERW